MKKSEKFVEVIPNANYVKLNNQMNNDDNVKLLLQVLAQIEYENYLEIKVKANSSLTSGNECRILPLIDVNSGCFYQVA